MKLFPQFLKQQVAIQPGRLNGASQATRLHVHAVSPCRFPIPSSTRRHRRRLRRAPAHGDSVGRSVGAKSSLLPENRRDGVRPSVRPRMGHGKPRTRGVEYCADLPVCLAGRAGSPARGGRSAPAVAVECSLYHASIHRVALWQTWRSPTRCSHEMTPFFHYMHHTRCIAGLSLAPAQFHQKCFHIVGDALQTAVRPSSIHLGKGAERFARLLCVAIDEMRDDATAEENNASCARLPVAHHKHTASVCLVDMECTVCTPINNISSNMSHNCSSSERFNL